MLQGSGNTNLALRDMRKALAWIQENIGAFGGNKDLVTIWVRLSFRAVLFHHLTEVRASLLALLRSVNCSVSSIALKFAHADI